MIEVKNLTKRYKNVLALDDLSLTFADSGIYGLLGGNGAGKSTLIKIISNRIFKTAGDVLVDGQPVKENEAVLDKIFCITEGDRYPSSLTVKALFRWEKAFYPSFDVAYAEQLAASFELALDKKVSTLSTGYQTILKTILTLASGCPIMILDEPVNGIDSYYRALFYDALSAHYQKHHNLIILATHLIDEIEPVLEQVVILADGRLVKSGALCEFVSDGQRLNDIYVALLKEVRHGSV